MIFMYKPSFILIVLGEPTVPLLYTKGRLHRFEKTQCKLGHTQIEQDEKRRNENEFGVVFGNGRCFSERVEFIHQHESNHYIRDVADCPNVVWRNVRYS